MTFETLRRRGVEEKKREQKERGKLEALRAKLALSKQHFKDSGLDDLTIELKKASSREIKFKDISFGRDSHEIPLNGNFIYEVTVDEFEKGTRDTLYFEIVVTPEGEIKINGDKDKGSSIVPKDVWSDGEKREEVFEKALVKAYDNPQRELYMD